MDYVSRLSKEELEIICEMIGAKEIRNFFEKNSRLFAKIQGGFRASKLSDARAISLLVQNIRNRDICNYVNVYIKCMLNDIASCTEPAEISARLAKSTFADHLDLYIKLKSENADLQAIPDECLALMKSGIDSYNHVSDTDENDSTKDEVDALKQQIEDLTTQLEQCQSEQEKQRTAYDAHIEEYTDQISSLKNELSEKVREAQQALDTVAKQKTELEELKSQDVEVLDELQDGEFRYTSFCAVEDDAGFDTGRKLIRLADVVRGRLEPFVFNHGKKAYFENREWLFWNNGPRKAGTFGIWNWSSIPNLSDSSKDYNRTKFNPNLSPIELIEVTGNSIDSVKAALLNGIDANPCCKRTIFYISLSERSKVGLLCEDAQLKNENGKMYVQTDVFALKQYEFTLQDIVFLEGKAFFKALDIKQKCEIVPMKDPLEAVRKFVLDRATWNALKQREVTKREWKIFQDFLSEMPSTELYQDMILAYGCDETQAEAYVKQFVQQATKYICSTDIEEEVLAEAIENHPDLFKRCNILAAEKWKQNHRQAIQTAEKNKKELIQQNKEQQIQLADAKKRLDVIKTELLEKEQLASSIDDKVTAKIETARKNAADFISEMAFRFPTTQTIQSASIPVQYHEGIELDEDGRDAYDTWDDLLGIIADELETAGVSSNFAPQTAAYMYSAYINNTPLLLAGPNAADISNAFSAALFGKTADHVDCMDGYSADIMERILRSDEPLIVLNSPFDHEWISRIPEILTHAGKYIILTHPFAEDIQIEPSGLFHYCLPVLTELFVNAVPDGRYCGGRESSEFMDYESAEKKSFHNRLLKTMHMGALTRTRLQQVLTDMHIMRQMDNKDVDDNGNADDNKNTDDNKNVDDDYLFGLLPYAYMTGNTDILREKIKSKTTDKKGLSKDMRDLLLSFLGDET